MFLDTYTAQATVGDVNKGITNHKVEFLLPLCCSQLTPLQNLESSDVSLLVFGNGDGGGGPLAKMLENVSFCSHFFPTASELRLVTASSHPRC